MNMDKTKFGRETVSEEVDLRNFVDDEEEEKENREQDDFGISGPLVQMSSTPQKPAISKEISTNTSVESYSSFRSSTTYTTMDKSYIGITVPH